MRDAQLATHLANTLTDAEFELLVRYRCQRIARELVIKNPNFDDSHTRFTFRWAPEADDNGWQAYVGINYGKCEESRGEVLSISVDNAVNALNARFANKISGLLSAPVESTDADNTD
jgi:hypothetical protein